MKIDNIFQNIKEENIRTVLFHIKFRINNLNLNYKTKN